MSRLLQLQGDIRQAIENYLGEYTSSKAWDDVVETVATIIDNGSVTLGQAMKLSYALEQTRDPTPDECPTCGKVR